MKTIDLTLYGATGFTGQLVLAYLRKIISNQTIAIAGRRADKLASVNAKFNGSFKMMVANANDRAALDKISKRSKVILNTAGPFHRLGTHLIESCLANHCHYLDITGETFWVQDYIFLC